MFLYLFCPTLQYILRHSFIHTEHLYSASSRELLRGAPDSSTAKKRSLLLFLLCKQLKINHCRSAGINGKNAELPFYPAEQRNVWVLSLCLLASTMESVHNIRNKIYDKAIECAY